MAPAARTGATMYILAALALIALLTMLFSGALDERRNPNRSVSSRTQTDGTTSITLERNRMGHYVVTGALNGVSTEFLLDTGATTVSVSIAVATRAGLRRGPQVATATANGVTGAYLTRIDEILIGGLAEHDIDAVIVPNLPGDQVLLGMSFLERLDFSQRGDTLVLHSRSGAPAPGSADQH